jgi:hypothetical protein
MLLLEISRARASAFRLTMSDEVYAVIAKKQVDLTTTACVERAVNKPRRTGVRLRTLIAWFFVGVTTLLHALHSILDLLHSLRFCFS